jgi:hypothetical protein
MEYVTLQSLNISLQLIRIFFQTQNYYIYIVSIIMLNIDKTLLNQLNFKISEHELFDH